MIINADSRAVFTYYMLKNCKNCIFLLIQVVKMFIVKKMEKIYAYILFFKS